VSTLDELLDLARGREPEDDGFTEIVMQAIRRPSRHASATHRFFTRPAVLAAAAVLATGGALAAAVRTARAPTTQASPSAAPAGALRQVAPRGQAIAPASTAARRSPDAQTSVAAPRSTPAWRPTAFRNTTYEWGSTSPHTAYVLDRRTGLRVDVDTRETALRAGGAHDVVVSVKNTTDSPVGVSSQGGCAVSAAVWTGGPGTSSAAPGTSRDPAKARYWTCDDGTAGRAGGAEEFVLAPHAARTSTIRFTLGAGTWSVAAVCRCDVVTAVSPGGGMTFGGLPASLVNGQASSGTSALMTPLLGVKAS
jgi:hypothetical protein